MFTVDSLDDHPQTILINRRRLMALGLIPPERLADAADAYRAYLLKKHGMNLDRRRVITHCERLPR